MKREDEASERLILRAYAAAQDRTRMPEFLDEISRQFSAHAVWMRVHDAGHATPRYLYSSGLSPEEVARSDMQLSDHNPWRAKGFDDMLNDGVGHGETILSRRELVRTTYYNEVLAPLDIDYGMGICLWANPPQQAVVISLNRSHSQAGSFAGDLPYAKHLLPHLRSVYAVMRRLSWAESERRSLASGIERLGAGVILVDGEGRCVYLNARAEEALAGNVGLSMTIGRTLRCALPEAQRLLQSSLVSAANGVLASPQRIYLRDAVGAIRLALVVTMLKGDFASLGAKGHDPCAAVFVHSPERSAAEPESLLRDAFGFTRAESRLATLLADGADAVECTHVLGVTMATARTQIRSLLAKTGTRRQVDLVAAVNFVLRVG